MGIGHREKAAFMGRSLLESGNWENPQTETGKCNSADLISLEIGKLVSLVHLQVEATDGSGGSKESLDNVDGPK